MTQQSKSKLLLHYLSPQKGGVSILIILVLITITLQLINPQFIRQFLDTVHTSRELAPLIKTAVIFTSIALLTQLLKFISMYLGERIAWTATNNLRADLTEHCLNLDISFHKKHKPGELIERIDGDINLLTNFFSQLFIQLSSNSILLVGIIILLWFVDWHIGASITVIAILGVFALNWLNKLIVPLWEKVRQTSSDLFGYLDEWLNGTAVIRTNNAQPYILNRLYQLQRNRWRTKESAMWVNMGVNGIPLIVPAFAYAAAYIWGEQLFQADKLSIGSIYLIIYYIDLLKSPLWQIQRQIQDLQQASAGLNRILALLAEQPTIHNGPIEQLPSAPLGIAFNQLSFQYETDEELILDKIDFTLNAGQTLGLIGRTGSGKTTLTRLLFRFYDPTTGSINLLPDNEPPINLTNLNLGTLRQKIGLVTQEVELFHASLRDNLTIFDDSIDDQQLLTALEQLGLKSWIEQLPQGLDTRLAGSEGVSAGEAQLLALARIFLADPAIIILDEASSRLDPATEQLLERGIDTLLKGRTAIIIAHRLNTIQRADQILILQNGRILEYAPRTQLAQDPTSHFAQLLKAGQLTV